MKNSRTEDVSIRYGERNGRDTCLFFFHLAQLCAYRHRQIGLYCMCDYGAHSSSTTNRLRIFFQQK